MSEALHRKRCFNHESREAVARCPECAHFYCRECVTEHEGRVLCVRCLGELTGAEQKKRKRRFIPSILIQAVVGFFVLWFIFTLLGEGLAIVPDEFHEGQMMLEE